MKKKISRKKAEIAISIQVFLTSVVGFYFGHLLLGSNWWFIISFICITIALICFSISIIRNVDFSNDDE